MLAGMSTYQVGPTSTVQLPLVTFKHLEYAQVRVSRSFFDACELVLLVILDLVCNPDSVAWRVAFGAVAFLPGTALLIF